MQIAKERGQRFEGFETLGKYASGEFFAKYIEKEWAPQTERTRELFANHIPTREEWIQLAADVAQYGMYNQNLQAVPPTGSISYINGLTSSIHPIASKIEIRRKASSAESLPGTLHDQREPGVLPGLLRNWLREDHRHLRCGKPSTWTRACR